MKPPDPNLEVGEAPGLLFWKDCTCHVEAENWWPVWWHLVQQKQDTQPHAVTLEKSFPGVALWLLATKTFVLGVVNGRSKKLQEAFSPLFSKGQGYGQHTLFCVCERELWSIHDTFLALLKCAKCIMCVSRMLSLSHPSNSPAKRESL